MTKINFPVEYPLSSDFARHHTDPVSFDRISNNTGHLRMLHELTDVPPEEFKQIDIPGSAIYHEEVVKAADRMPDLERSAQRGYAASYLIYLNQRLAGIASFMYPGATRFGFGDKLKQKLAPDRNPSRDFAGWLRKDRLSGFEPIEAAQVVFRSAIDLARDSEIRRLGVSIGKQVAKTPETEHLISIESQAPRIGLVIANDQTPQRTEGKSFPGTRYVMDLTL